MVGPFVMSPAATAMPNCAERFDQGLLDVLQLGRIGRDPAFDIVFIEQIEPGQRVIFGVPCSDSLGQSAVAAFFSAPRSSASDGFLRVGVDSFGKRGGIDHFRLRPIGQFFRRNEGRGRFRHRRAFLLQLLFDRRAAAWPVRCWLISSWPFKSDLRSRRSQAPVAQVAPSPARIRRRFA